MICRFCAAEAAKTASLENVVTCRKARCSVTDLNPRYCVDHELAIQEEEQRKAMVAATQEAMTIQEGAVD